VTRTLLPLFFLLAACGGRPSIVTPDAALDGPPADGAAPDAAIPDQSRPDVLPSKVAGLVYLVENQDVQSGAQQGAAFVFFTPDPMGFFTPQKDLGSGCASFPLEAFGLTQFSAGKVTITGGPYDVTLEPDAAYKPGDWRYPGILFPDLFSAGSKLKVHAAGHEVPKFADEMFGVGELAVSLPTSSPVTRGAPLSISYTPDKGTIWVTLTATKGKSVLASIRCTDLASSGTFTIPAAVTATIPTSATHLELGAGLVAQSKHSWIQSNGNSGQISFVAFHRRYATLVVK
jgi:hypothetical protein